MNSISSWNGSSRSAAITHGPSGRGYQSCTPGIRHAPARVAASRRPNTQVCDSGVFFNLETWLIAAKVCDCGTLKRRLVHKPPVSGGVLMEECSQLSVISVQVLAFVSRGNAEALAPASLSVFFQSRRVAARRFKVQLPLITGSPHPVKGRSLCDSFKLAKHSSGCSHRTSLEPLDDATTSRN